MSEWLVLLGIVTTAAGGAAGYLFGRASIVGQYATTALALLGAGLGLGGVLAFWADPQSRPIAAAWPLPGAEFRIAVDGVSAVFLLPVFLISAMGQVYGLGYWSAAAQPRTGRRLRLFYAALTAAMALMTTAGNSVLFLFAWEVMALSAYFLVTTESDDPEVRSAGWVYLVAAHTATLCLFAMFALLHGAVGSFSLERAPAGAISPAFATAIFVLALLGFGLKAGIMPLHVWLPSAHAAAPSHVSALLSGVIIKMGVYGLVRTVALLPTPPVEWGAAVLALGVVSGVLGVAFALGQHDIKRLLAYHSIENVGIIVMGLGLAMIGLSTGRAGLVVLGLTGGLLHVWNHAIFKALLFFGAGSVVHAVHTREMDHMGGLGRAMPITALCFLTGAVAICGLPPLNGFVGEFIIYLGLFRSAIDAGDSSFPIAAFAAPALALIGALAVACFVKVFGTVFLGTPRTPQAAAVAGESPPSMIAAMSVLALCCVFIGAAPIAVAPAFRAAVADWAPAVNADRVGEPIPWIGLTAAGSALAALIAGSALLLRARVGRGPVSAAPTWGCGYPAPTPRMQYTSASFAQMLVDLFSWALRPRVHRPQSLPLFPDKADFHSKVADPVLEEAAIPAFRLGARVLSWFRVLQQGSVRLYLLYVFVVLVALLLWR